MQPVNNKIADLDMSKNKVAKRRICVSLHSEFHRSLAVAAKIAGGGTPQAAAAALALSLEMKTIAKLSRELAGVVPVRPAKRIRAVEQVARIADVLRCE